MATKSIYKNITIKSKPLAEKLISALENAERESGKEIIFFKRHHTATTEEIKNILECK